MTATIDTSRIVKEETSRFAHYLKAYMECDESIRSIVHDMANIVNDEESSDEEREHAADAMLEALFPGLSDDWVSGHRKWVHSDDAKESSSPLEEQEEGFAARVKAIMDERGWTQEKLAAETGVSQPAISNILNRECRPQQRTVSRFAEAFGVDPGDLWPPLADGA